MHNSDEFDIAPPPQERLEIMRCRDRGWIVIFEGEPIAAHSTIEDVARWLVDSLGPLDRETHEQPVEPLPNVLMNETPPRRRVWHVLIGGKAS